MISVAEYLDLCSRLASRGYASEREWAQSVSAPANANDFAYETCWVILNSGMKEQVARTLWERLRPILDSGGTIQYADFKHDGKRAALNHVWVERINLFEEWRVQPVAPATDQIDWLAIFIPWIGPIMKYHLARNLGVDCVKPDRHLMRIAEIHGTSPTRLCSTLAEATGDRIGTVDVVLWRAANLGII